MKKQRVVILCGGRSAERDVSKISARRILDSLDRGRFEPEFVEIGADGRWDQAALLKAARRSPPVVFPALHGPMGEDGTIQGWLEIAGLAYVGCGVLGSAVGMDKEAAKILAARAGIPVVPYLVARGGKIPADAAERLGLPIFVKPARLGSSVGVRKVKMEGDLAAAIEDALRYDDKIILEKGLDAREIECAVLGDPWSNDPGDPLRLSASVCGEIIPRREFYDYAAKYVDPDGARLSVPAELMPEFSERVRAWSLRAFRALDGYAMGRMDFLIDKKTGEAFFNEINTIPGFTASSMYPLLWKESGLETKELVSRLIDLALRRRKAKSRLASAPPMPGAGRPAAAPAKPRTLAAAARINSRRGRRGPEP